jgi:hypothetical protein
MDRNGRFSLPIPSGLDSLQITVYDPKTGYVDPDFWHGRLRRQGERFLTIEGVYLPDTSTIQHYLSIDQYVEDEVSMSEPRHQFHVFIPQSAVDHQLNIGMRATEPLTLWFQDPGGGFIYRDSIASCANVYRFVPSVSGTYRVTVTYGVGGGDGPFAVGASYDPAPPTPYLCGNIPYDSLSAQYSPYISGNPSTVVANDTIFVHASTTIQFEQGGSITGNGLLKGQGTSSNPIRMVPYNPAAARDLSSSGVLRKRQAQVAGGKR